MADPIVFAVRFNKTCIPFMPTMNSEQIRRYFPWLSGFTDEMLEHVEQLTIRTIDAGVLTLKKEWGEQRSRRSYTKWGGAYSFLNNSDASERMVK